jgi:hypothetical protein
MPDRHFETKLRARVQANYRAFARRSVRTRPSASIATAAGHPSGERSGESTGGKAGWWQPASLGRTRPSTALRFPRGRRIKFPISARVIPRSRNVRSSMLRSSAMARRAANSASITCVIPFRTARMCSMPKRMSEPHRGWRRGGALMLWISLSDCCECIPLNLSVALFVAERTCWGVTSGAAPAPGHDR